MNELQSFYNVEFGTIRTISMDGEVWFVGKDVAVVLGYSNPRDAISKHIDEEDKGVTKCDTLGGIQEMTIINESGLYSLIFSSKLPTAKAFKRWVTAEVLPSIRKKGSYTMATEQQEVMMAYLPQAIAMLGKEITYMTQSINKLLEVLDKHFVEKQMETPKSEEVRKVIQPLECYRISQCKLETFPSELVEQVNEMLETMMQQQNLNFSMIARFCTVNGYSISSPSVKTYFEKKFLDI